MSPSAANLGAVLRFGAHVPRLRLARSTIVAALSWLNPPSRATPRGARSIANWDEDALTMGVEAARACLGLALPAGQLPDALSFCSTTAPFADRDDAVVVNAALGASESVETRNLGASLRAGTAGLIGAARRPDSSTLIVASDARLARPGSPQDLLFGDAAAALLVGPYREGALASVLAVRSAAQDFVDHYRMSGAQFDYTLEERWVRDEFLMQLVPKVTGELLAAAGCAAAEVRHLALPATAASAKRIAEACGFAAARRDESVLAECGDAGVALPLLLLGASLEHAEPGDLIVVIGLGQGVDAVLLRAESGVGAARQALTRTLAAKRDEPSYTRYLSHRGLLDVDFGMRAERDQRTAHSVAHRRRDALTAFTGGRCARCGTVQFPRARMCVNPECRAQDTQSPYRLAESSGRVKTFTEDWQAYAARPPYLYGNVEFSEGGNLLMEFTDIEAGELAIDAAVRFVFRIKDQDRARGFRRYFWKATLA
jgi:3-hydroxy-3-methylglutaryl CoA synthase